MVVCARRLSALPTLLLVAAACTVGVEDRGAPEFPEPWSFSIDAEATVAARAMVVTTDAIASEVGLEVLARGGNAIDAAVATAFALAVVNPEAGNIGGGGFLIVRTADGEVAALDFRERAPIKATRDMFLDEAGALTNRSVVGHLSAGVPGTVLGLWDAHQRFGSVPWAGLVAPAVRLAEGFVVTERLAHSLADSRASLALYEATRTAFLPAGEPPDAGTTFRQLDLAVTLERIQRGGSNGFYRGTTADLIAEEMARGGGLMTSIDLEAYRTAWREPVTFTYRKHTVYSMPPSSSGGATLAETANLLARYDLAALGWHSPASIHLTVEAWRRAFADRNELLADTDYVSVPLARLLSTGYASTRGADIDRGRATSSAEVGPGLVPARGGGDTTHFSIVDGYGNAVAVTTTLNSWYGSKVTVAGAGFLLNNEMDDFAARPGTPNQFGLVQGEANAVEGGKRMLSAMTPTVVLDPDGDLALVVGTPGGPTIITTVFQVLSNVIDFGMSIGAAVNAPRVHHQHLPDEIAFEVGGLDAVTVAGLEAMGHRVVERDPGPPDAYFSGGLSGDVQAIRVRPDGTLEGYSDPRRGGAASGF
jgi:gamma-glutamyltranspeptidase/glutathione hydrolase